MTKLGFNNARLLYSIKLPYFWGIVSRFIIKCMINDSDQISSKINTLNSSINGIV